MDTRPVAIPRSPQAPQDLQGKGEGAPVGRAAVLQGQAEKVFPQLGDAQLLADPRKEVPQDLLAALAQSALALPHKELVGQMVGPLRLLQGNRMPQPREVFHVALGHVAFRQGEAQVEKHTLNHWQMSPVLVETRRIIKGNCFAFARGFLKSALIIPHNVKAL